MAAGRGWPLLFALGVRCRAAFSSSGGESVVKTRRFLSPFVLKTLVRVVWNVNHQYVRGV